MVPSIRGVSELPGLLVFRAHGGAHRGALGMVGVPSVVLSSSPDMVTKCRVLHLRRDAGGVSFGLRCRRLSKRGRGVRAPKSDAAWR